MVVGDSDPCALLHLPPGFRFYPTDEELLIQYLCKKIAGYQFPMPIIADVNLYKFDAWDLPNKALFGEKEWYFFSLRDRKYPNGSRPNRVAGGGYWKATGTDKIVTVKGRKVGIKKSLVFYIGKAPKGSKTSWIMHEYRLSEPPQRSSGGARLDDWVLCRVYMKKTRAAAIDSDRGRGKEHIQSMSTCVSGDVMDLDSSPEINDSFFNRPEMDSAKGFDLEKDQKPIILRPGSGDYFDWSSIDATETLGPEIVQAEDAAPAVDFEFSGHRNNVVGPATTLEDEIQSGRGYHLLGGSWDPFWPNYSAQNSGFGFL